MNGAASWKLGMVARGLQGNDCDHLVGPFVCVRVTPGLGHTDCVATVASGQVQVVRDPNLDPGGCVGVVTMSMHLADHVHSEEIPVVLVTADAAQSVHLSGSLVLVNRGRLLSTCPGLLLGILFDYLWEECYYSFDLCQGYCLCYPYSLLEEFRFHGHLCNLWEVYCSPIYHSKMDSCQVHVHRYNP